MKNKTLILFLFSISIIIFLGFSLFRSIEENKKIRDSLPYLMKNERVDYFNLTGEDGTIINSSNLGNNPISLIFIYSRPCSPCEKNTIYWKKITSILKNNVTVYGIILGEMKDAFDFARKYDLNFSIYVPVDTEKFMKKMRIKLNFSQTIVYTDKVEFIKLGDLDGDDAVKIIQVVRGKN